MKKNTRAAILVLTIMSVWGIIYPQYTLTEDMYKRTLNGKELAEKDCRKDYWNILTAERGEVKVRFSLLEKIEELARESKADGKQ